MKTYAISQLASAVGLSRSTLLYYDRLGLLVASGRTGAGYRRYTNQDRRRLERIRRFREAGLTLKDIRAVLISGGKPGAALLEQRLQETTENIQALRHRQHLLAGMLRRIAAGRMPATVDKELWVRMLEASGMDDRAMEKWHREFEERAPEGHHDFLLSLGISPQEVASIRRRSSAPVRRPRDGKCDRRRTTRSNAGRPMLPHG
ncbi:MAG: MerR family transcriptional regulator [Verrucomicrobiales bacterium]|nr:MerR family transcriptional regulator [Verrucomicrobiales bacterium]